MPQNGSRQRAWPLCAREVQYQNKGKKQGRQCQRGGKHAQGLLCLVATELMLAIVLVGWINREVRCVVMFPGLAWRLCEQQSAEPVSGTEHIQARSAAVTGHKPCGNKAFRQQKRAQHPQRRAAAGLVYSMA